MSKGSQRRPAAVSAEQFASNWERAFGKPQAKKPVTKTGKRYGKRKPE